MATKCIFCGEELPHILPLDDWHNFECEACGRTHELDASLRYRLHGTAKALSDAGTLTKQGQVSLLAIAKKWSKEHPNHHVNSAPMLDRDGDVRAGEE